MAPNTEINQLIQHSFSRVQPDYVIALGGNAFGKGDPSLHGNDYWESLRPNIQIASREIARLVFEGKKVIVTHGNGPQVGALFGRRPETALHRHVSVTQAHMGNLLREEIGKALADFNWNGRSIPKIVKVPTQVEVQADDPAFQRPTKPIGWFTEEDAEMLASKRPTWRHALVDPDKSDGWRLLVPSPIPTKIIEINEIQSWLNEGMIVIAAGGGGIPVASTGNGLEPVEAVIDKDRASAILAAQLNAKAFVILTAVPKVALNFKDPEKRRWVDQMTLSQARQSLRSGDFPPGSMGPKIEGALYFTEATGNRTLITELGHLQEALEGETGTWLVPEFEMPNLEAIEPAA